MLCTAGGTCWPESPTQLLIPLDPQDSSPALNIQALSSSSPTLTPQESQDPSS